MDEGEDKILVQAYHKVMSATKPEICIKFGYPAYFKTI